AGPKVNPAPHAEEVGIFRIVEGMGCRDRRKQPRNRNRDRSSENHSCSPLTRTQGLQAEGRAGPNGTVAATTPIQHAKTRSPARSEVSGATLPHFAAHAEEDNCPVT